MRKKGTWFMKDWLAYWQEISTSSRWHRGRTISHQNPNIDCTITAGRVSTSVKGSEIYRQEMRCLPLDYPLLQQIKSTLTEKPSLLMKIYTKEMQGVFTEMAFLSSLFSIPPLQLSCTCPDEVVPCKHLVASAFAVGGVFEENPFQYVLFRGIPWEEVLANMHLNGSSPSINSHEEKVKYGMVALPAHPSPSPVMNRWKMAPPFWTSPFPFPLIMEEIYSKVEDTEEEK